MSETETKVYDVPEVLAALEAAVAKRGADYVYENTSQGGPELPSCLYTHRAEDGTLVPGCLVGQVYHDLTGQLIPLTGDDQDGGVRHNPYTRQVFTDAAIVVLDKAQALQDRFCTWGDALAAAEALEAEV